MKIISDTYPIEIVANDGYCLTNGESYSTYVVLSNIDNIENWHEVSIQEVPEEYGLFREDSLFN